MLKPIAVLLVSVFAASVSVEVSEAQSEARPQSAVLQQLSRDIEQDSDALDEFWARMELNGVPLVESVSDQPGHSLLTFVYRAAEGTRVRLRSNLNALLIDGITNDFDSLGSLNRLTVTDVNYLSFEVSDELRITYRFVVSGESEPVLDPLNSRVYMPGTRFARSAVSLSDAPAQPWADIAEAGRWNQHIVESRALGDSQTIWVYTPSGYDAERSHPVLIGMDVVAYARILPTSRVVEYLAAEGRIPPTIIIAVPDLGWVGDRRGSYDPAVDFLADEVLPAVGELYSITSDPSEVVVSGLSRRGMLSAYATLRRPDAFGNVLSLSGSYYWRPQGHSQFEWLSALYAREDRRPIRFYLAAGSLETVVTSGNAGHYMVGTNRHMRDVLIAKGYDLRYHEFYGVHSTFNWQDQLLPGLDYLLGRQPQVGLD